MKKFILVAFFLFTFCIAHTQTYAVQFVNSSREETFCPGADLDRIVYIENQRRSIFTVDHFTSNQRRAISDFQSKVTLWQSDKNLVS